jgi:hypothetical protein
MKLKLPPALSGGQAGRGPGFGNSTLEYAANGRYIFPMADQLRFAGTVVRVEADGFGIIKFDQPIGRSGNTIGIFSSSTSSSLPFNSLRPGVHVAGTAEADERDAAAIRTITLP